MPRDNTYSPADLAAHIRKLHRDLQDARRCLTTPTPEALDECRGRLETVAAALVDVKNAIPRQTKKQNAPLRAPLQSLQGEINQVALLLDSAAVFQAGWMRRAASLASGYMAGGIPTPSQAGRRLWTEV